MNQNRKKSWEEIVKIIRDQPSAEPEAKRPVRRNLHDTIIEWLKSEEPDSAKRPSFDTVFMRTAELMAERGTCPRLRVGAVIAVDNRIIATGYNGAPAGLPHCTEVGCLQLKCPHCDGTGLVRKIYTIDMKHCPKCDGTGKAGSCKRTTHAEANALIQCAKYGVSPIGGVLYTTHRPCVACAGLIITAGIAVCCWKEAYNSDSSADAVADMFDQAGVSHGIYSPEAA